jgi:hypothetical protein
MLSYSIKVGGLPLSSVIGIPPATESSFLEVTLYVMFLKKSVLEWTIPAEWGNCKFEVYYSETEVGPFDKLTPTPISTFFFEDTSFEEYSKFRNSFYKVVCMLPDGRRTSSPVLTWENRRSSLVDIRAREISRREHILLSKFTGIKSLLFRRKFFGQRCTRCYNHTMEKVMEDNCPVCIGTGFEGGYFPGREIFVQYEPTPNPSQLGYAGVSEQNTIPAWTVEYPMIETFDIVLRIPDSKIYRVSSIANTELQTKTVRQMLTLTELAKTSIEYELAKQAIPTKYL